MHIYRYGGGKRVRICQPCRNGDHARCEENDNLEGWNGMDLSEAPAIACYCTDGHGEEEIHPEPATREPERQALAAKLRRMAEDFWPRWACPLVATPCSPDAPHRDCSWVHSDENADRLATLVAAAVELDWPPPAPEAAGEIDRLRGWKESAMLVLAEWDQVHEALGSPGRPGESKAAASRVKAARLVAAKAVQS